MCVILHTLHTSLLIFALTPKLSPMSTSEESYTLQEAVYQPPPAPKPVRIRRVPALGKFPPVNLMDRFED